MTTPSNRLEDQKSSLVALSIVNRILIKIIASKNKKTLFFIILNDSFYAIPYDRAVLMQWGDYPKILGVSGEYQEAKRSELPEKWLSILQNIKTPTTPQLLEETSFPDGFQGWKGAQAEMPSSVIWEPLITFKNGGIGFWIEKWKGGTHGDSFTKDQIEFLHIFLTPAYTEALKKETHPFKKYFLRKLLKNYWKILLFIILLATLFIRIPLRVVAPSEVVPKKPIIVAAPIEGIIEEVLVQPGQHVLKGNVLVEYDKKVYQQELKAAQKTVQIAQEELTRAFTLGLKEEKSLSEISELELKLEKEKIHLKLVEVQMNKLTITASEDGVVIMQNPEEWRGKPVKIGEKIITLGNPHKTQLKAWIPENDYIPIDFETPVNVYLNVAPEKALHAKITFVSNESVLNEAQIPSFIAEADWVEESEETRLGLKGTTVLYGNNVSLLYYILRKPISTFRRLSGI